VTISGFFNQAGVFLKTLTKQEAEGLRENYLNFEYEYCADLPFIAAELVENNPYRYCE